ncbi:MAG: hypothetical protein RL624_867 [Bacteroidota bacterium]|jgi:glycerol-3-phosphate dehydrogenase (NAD(P)+)
MEDAKKYLGKIGIIGNGSWGTALAKMLNDNQIPFTWWIRDEKAIQHLTKRSHNLNYLTSVQFNMELISLSSDLNAVLKEANTLIFCVPSAYAQEVIESVSADCWQGKHIISAIKGILPKPHQLINDYLAANYAFPIAHYAAITGPCHAEEVANERLSYLTFSSLNTELAKAAATLFKTNYINTFYNNDIWGAQFAAVLKNIYAVGAGIAHGLDYGDNFLSVYITNCYKEMYQFLNYHFEKIHPSNEVPDFHTSAYLGDLLVTCYSLHSRNRMFGNMIGKGYSVKAAIIEMKMVAEGYYAAKGMDIIQEELGIQMPISKAIFDILWNNKNAEEVFKEIESFLS